MLSGCYPVERVALAATVLCAGVGVPTTFPAGKLLTVQICHTKFGVCVLLIKNQRRKSSW